MSVLSPSFCENFQSDLLSESTSERWNWLSRGLAPACFMVPRHFSCLRGSRHSLTLVNCKLMNDNTSVLAHLLFPLYVVRK